MRYKYRLSTVSLLGDPATLDVDYRYAVSLLISSPTLTQCTGPVASEGRGFDSRGPAGAAWPWVGRHLPTAGWRRAFGAPLGRFAQHLRACWCAGSAVGRGR